MMDDAEVGGRREDERAVASAQDSRLFSYIAGQWHRVLWLQEGKGDIRLWELPSEGPSYCLLLRAVSSQLSSRPFSHPSPALFAERQPDMITKLPFCAGAMPAPVHLSLAQGQTANLGFFQLLRCWFSQYLYVPNCFGEFCLLLQIGWNQPTDSEALKREVGEKQTDDSGTFREEKKEDFNKWYSGAQTNEFFFAVSGKQWYVDSSVGTGVSFECNSRHTQKAAQVKLHENPLGDFSSTFGLQVSSKVKVWHLISGYPIQYSD